MAARWTGIACLLAVFVPELLLALLIYAQGRYGAHPMGRPGDQAVGLFGRVQKALPAHRTGQLSVPMLPRRALPPLRLNRFLFPAEIRPSHIGVTAWPWTGDRRQVYIRRKAADYDFHVGIDSIEAGAEDAAGAWSFYCTPFMELERADKVMRRLDQRSAFSMTRVPFENSRRSKLIFTNPDLPVEGTDFYTVLLVENVDLASADPWANVLTAIGVDFWEIGDVVVFPDTGLVYIVLSPPYAKMAMRLLPKELPGTGVTVSKLGPGDVIPEGGQVQEMVVKRLDKRRKQEKPGA